MFRAHTLLLAGLLATLSSAVIIDMEGLPDTGLNTSTWVTGVAPPLDDLYDLNDLQIAAKNTLLPASYGMSFCSKAIHWHVLTCDVQPSTAPAHSTRQHIKPT